MHLIVYISDYTGKLADIDAELQNIVLCAKYNNLRMGITGVLFFHNGKFIQIIEGDQVDLRTLMKKLEQDSRHNNITYILDESVTDRGFANWNMDSFNLSSVQTIDADVLNHVAQAYKKNLLPRADLLTDTFKSLFQDEILAALQQ